MQLRIPMLLPIAFLSAGLPACGSSAADDAGTDSSSGSGGVSAAGGSGGSGGVAASGGVMAAGGSEADPCAPRPGALTPKVVSVDVKNENGEAPKKGDRLVFTVTLTNTGAGVGPITVTPRIDSSRFSDYTDVPVGSAEATLCEDGATVDVHAGPFLDDEARGKHYAVGSGDYTVSGIDVDVAGSPVTFDTFDGAAFTVSTSNVLLVPVIYDADYFQEVQGQTTSTPEEYLTQAFTRPEQVFTPTSASDPDGAGSYQSYAGGFDEMMGVKHLFRAFPGFPGENETTDGWCEDATHYGQTVLGMAETWGTAPQETRPERHGFDYLLALTPDMGGGVACGWLDVQVSSLINNDLDRQQIVAVHETGHLFGAPHCDDVGNGSDGPLQGYVMCSGEKHPSYPGTFVFHSTSLSHMSSRWN